MPLDDYSDLLHRCFRCGYCKKPSIYGYNCPSYNRYRMETYSPGGRLWLIRALADKALPLSAHTADILYSCTMCGNCQAHCCLEFKEDILDMLTAAREQLVDESVLPRNVQKYLENVYGFHNPWKKSRKRRGDWAAGTGIRLYDAKDRYLFYVGDAGSYIPRAAAASRAVGTLMHQAGVSFGILGPEEISDGNDARDMGETALFEHLRDQNIALFEKKGIRKIITYSPHAYHVMTHAYAKVSGQLSVFHYLEVIRQLLSQGRIHLSVSRETPVKVTFHDSCFLGRRNKKYELPREILRCIPGVELVEMERNREDAFCCGGGNGNEFTDLLGGDQNSPGRVRVEEALSCGARVIAVSCPACLVMLDDAVSAQGVGDRIEVLDISEIIASAAVSKTNR